MKSGSSKTVKKLLRNRREWYAVPQPCVPRATVPPSGGRNGDERAEVCPIKRRVLTWSGGSIFLALGVAYLIPSSRYSMLGYLRGESFDSGRPQSYWVNALRDADPEVRQEGATCLARLGPQAADAIP